MEFEDRSASQPFSVPTPLGERLSFYIDVAEKLHPPARGAVVNKLPSRTISEHTIGSGHGNSGNHRGFQRERAQIFRFQIVYV